MCVTALPALSSVTNDQVLSQHIKEADGTSLQNTNSGSGVKTGHLQDSAVTSPKIADGTIATVDLANGAVTDAKITGPISSSKISSTGLNADTLDGKHAADLALATHNHDGIYQKKYGRVAVVATSGGDYPNPVSAMSNINTWCATPSADAPCLLKIMPGMFDIGSGILQMVEYVDIEGSGRDVTIIKGSPDTNYVVTANSNAELRSLTVQYGNCNNCAGITSSGEFPRIRDIRVTNLGQGGAQAIRFAYCQPFVKDLVTNANVINYQTEKATYINLETQDASISMDGTWFPSAYIASFENLNMTGGGMVIVMGPVIINNSRLVAPGGGTVIACNYPTTPLRINNSIISSPIETWWPLTQGCTVQMTNSELSTGGALIFGAGNMTAVNSKLDGALPSNEMINKLLNCYDGQYDPVVYP